MSGERSDPAVAAIDQRVGNWHGPIAGERERERGWVMIRKLTIFRD